MNTDYGTEPWALRTPAYERTPAGEILQNKIGLPIYKEMHITHLSCNKDS